MPLKTRREALQTVGGAALGALITGCLTRNFNASETTQSSGQNPMFRVRKSWHSKEASADRQIYMKAVQLLKQNDAKKLAPSSPDYWLSWTGLAAIHMHSCPHGNWYFLPWHRAYLRLFEKACQTVTQRPDFALPYWDWTSQPKVPNEFFTPRDGTNPFIETRKASAETLCGEEFVGKKVLERLMAIDDFYRFASFPARKLRDASDSGELEATPHNYIHVFVGGRMASFWSPLDPVFWLHHCNIDRLWAEWALAHRDASMPYRIKHDGVTYSPSDWTDFTVRMHFDAQNRFEAAAAKVSEVLTTQSSGYAFDTVNSLPEGASRATVARRVSSDDVVDIKETSSQIFRDSIAVSLDISDVALREKAKSLYSKKGKGSVYLRVNNFSVDALRQFGERVAVRFFGVIDEKVQLPNETLWQSWHGKHSHNNPSYIGTNVVFSPKGEGHHGHHGSTNPGITIDVSQWLRKNATPAFPKSVRVVMVVVSLDKDNAENKDLFPMESVGKAIDFNVVLRELVSG